MPPVLTTLVARASAFHPGNASGEFFYQWTHPGDVFSVLLILGGDVVARALAQSTGWAVGPPSFSFGWVAYSINALVAAVGENKLMPEPDCKCLVMNGKNGYARDNTSWVLGRLVRDYDAWMDSSVHDKVQEIIDRKWKEQKRKARQKQKPEPPRPLRAGLCVSIYNASPVGAVGEPVGAAMYVCSVLVAIGQLGVAAIPCGIFGDYGILMVTACGIILSSATASLSQWKAEKWACRRLPESNTGAKKVVLTRGNGSQHAIVIIGRAGFLDLEDLAGGQMNVDVSASMVTRATVFVLALLWILLLITASGLKENTWFLLAVGGIGILFNVVVAGNRRNPRSNGIPLEFERVIAEPAVMETLYQVEHALPHVGRSMRGIFFPGRLPADEEQEWKDLEGTADTREAQRVAGNAPAAPAAPTQ